MASTLKVQNIAHTGGTTAMTIDSSGRMFQSNRPFSLLTYKNTANSDAKWSTGGVLEIILHPYHLTQRLLTEQIVLTHPHLNLLYLCWYWIINFMYGGYQGILMSG